MPLTDCRIVQPNGSIRYTTHSGSILFDAQGTTLRMVGCVLDRTESLAFESKLRRTLAQLEEAQGFAKLGSWRWQPRTGEIEWSRELRLIAGLPLDVPPSPELFFERIVPEDRARFRDAYARVPTQLEPEVLDGRLRRPDGELRHFRMEGFSVVGTDGQLELRGTILRSLVRAARCAVRAGRPAGERHDARTAGAHNR